MNSIFVDTGAWTALLNEDDQFHDQAVELHQSLLRQGIFYATTELVFAEVGGNFSRASWHQAAYQQRKSFLSSARGKMIPMTDELFQIGWDYFLKHRDKDWSLVDCVSFVSMKKFGLQIAFAFDHHFVQAGFKLATP